MTTINSNKFVGLLGFGCSGNTAVADFLLQTLDFEVHVDYLEVDQLRTSNGLISILNSKKNRNTFESLKILIRWACILPKKIFWAFKHYRVSGTAGQQNRGNRNLQNYIKLEVVHLLILYKVLFGVTYKSEQDLIKGYLNKIHKIGCKTGQALIVNNPCFPEFMLAEMIEALEGQMVFVISIRNPLDSFIDIEKQEPHFNRKDLSSDFLTGCDATGKIKRHVLIRTLRIRIDYLKSLKAKYPRNIAIIKFEKLVHGDRDTLKYFHDFLLSAGIIGSKSEIVTERPDDFPRRFEPKKSRANIRSHACAVRILRALGYDDEILRELNDLEKEYIRLLG